MNGKKLERPLYLDMPFDEALRRYAQTKPGEVDPPSGRKRKSARPEPGAPVSPSVEDVASTSDGGKLGPE